MQVELLKKKSNYTDKKTGELKDITNFFLRCGDALIRIDVPYFPDPKHDDKDLQYASRRSVLSAFASVLPEKEDSAKSNVASKKEK